MMTFFVGATKKERLAQQKQKQQYTLINKGSKQLYNDRCYCNYLLTLSS